MFAEPLGIGTVMLAATLSRNIKVHFYKKKTKAMSNNLLGDIQKADVGVALAHFDFTLLQIYQAVNETERPYLFDLHQNPNDKCVVGRYIKPVLTEMFAEMEDAFAGALAGKTKACSVKKENELFL